MAITENATILIEIGYVTPEAVRALAKAIHGLATEGLIFVRRMGAAVALGGAEIVKVEESNSTKTVISPQPEILGPAAENGPMLFVGTIIFIAILVLSLFLLALRNVRKKGENVAYARIILHFRTLQRSVNRLSKSVHLNFSTILSVLGV